MKQIKKVYQSIHAFIFLEWLNYQKRMQQICTYVDSITENLCNGRYVERMVYIFITW